MYVLANLRDSGRAPGAIILRLSLARPASRATHTRAEEGAGGIAGGGVEGRCHCTGWGPLSAPPRLTTPGACDLAGRAGDDGVTAISSLRRWGDEIRVATARSQRVPSINFLSRLPLAVGRALPPRLPDTGFAR